MGVLKKRPKSDSGKVVKISIFTILHFVVVVVVVVVVVTFQIFNSRISKTGLN